MKPKHCWSGYKREGEVIVHKRNGGMQIGSRPAQGRRIDPIDIKRKLDEGIEPMELAKDEQYFHIVMRYKRSFEKYAAHKKRKLLTNER